MHGAKVVQYLPDGAAREVRSAFHHDPKSILRQAYRHDPCAGEKQHLSSTMAMPLLQLSLYHLHRIFVENILPAFATAPGNFTDTLDALTLTEIQRLLQKQIILPMLPRDAQLDEAQAALLARFSNLTDGARAIVLSCRTVNDALLTIFNDKAFKAFLRTSIHDDMQLKRLNRLLSDLRMEAPSMPVEPAQGAAAVDNGGVISPSTGPSPPEISSVRTLLPVPAAGGDLIDPQSLDEEGDTLTRLARLLVSNVQSPAALPIPETILSVQANAYLSAYRARSVVYKAGNERQLLTIEALLSLMLTGAEQQKIRTALNALFLSDLRHLLLAIAAFDASAQVRLPRPVAALVRVFVGRLFSQLNAVRSAEEIVRGVRESDLFATLPKGEKRRVQDLLAQCALRSGRAADAALAYRKIMIEHLDEPGPILNYVTSIYTSDIGEALSYSKLLLLNRYAVPGPSLIFIGDLLAHQGAPDMARLAFIRALQENPNFTDAYLGLANLATLKQAGDEWGQWMSRFFGVEEQQPRINLDEPLAPFRFVWERRKAAINSPTVTVVMTAFNAEQTLERAVRSVLEQTIANLEIMIVEDCSADETRTIIRRLCGADPRVKSILNESNMGTYASKNKGIRESSSEFVTFHDSDDWMHPRRLERHIAAMKPHVMCTTSNWIRMDGNGRVIVRRQGPYSHINPASTFFRREAFGKIGLFDSVRTGADSEMLNRMRHHFGKGAVVDLPDVLGIGLHHEASLTQAGVTAFDEHRFSPVRLEYTEAWVRWHLSVLLRQQSTLSLPEGPGSRPFQAPSPLLSAG